MTSFLGDLAKSLANIQNDIAKATTYCSLLVHEVMTRSTEHFERVDSQFVFDGVMATYRCSIDNHIYVVKITVEKK
jgi:hypothetical protein